MRRIASLLAVAGTGLALAVLPAAPASAVCTETPWDDCWMPCYELLRLYDTVDRTAKDKLPDDMFACLA